MAANESSNAFPFTVNFTPFHDRVLVLQASVDEADTGHIVIPDSQKEPPLEGHVIAVGPGRMEFGQHIKPSCQPGNRVLFSKFAGVEVTVDGVVYLLMRDEEILGRRPATQGSGNRSQGTDKPADHAPIPQADGDSIEEALATGPVSIEQARRIHGVLRLPSEQCNCCDDRTFHEWDCPIAVRVRQQRRSA